MVPAEAYLSSSAILKRSSNAIHVTLSFVNLPVARPVFQVCANLGRWVLLPAVYLFFANGVNFESFFSHIQMVLHIGSRLKAKNRVNFTLSYFGRFSCHLNFEMYTFQENIHISPCRIAYF